MMAFEAMKELSEGVPNYLEVPIEDGLLDKAAAVIHGLGYDMATQPLLLPRRDVFSVELTDYALPGFCSGWKPYFGSIEDYHFLQSQKVRS